MRRGSALLIALAVAIVMFHELTSVFAGGHVHGGAGQRPRSSRCTPSTSSVALPAILAGAAVGAALVVASASRAGIATLTRLGLPGLGRDARARANGLTWGAIAVLGVHFTGEAFDVFPGGHSVAPMVLGTGSASARSACIGTPSSTRRTARST